ncbi:MAG TPA: hypothetical protein EYG06_06265 [Myxococcales bacterium]|nr:hypothetical protein [Myxococcales bacterium]
MGHGAWGVGHGARILGPGGSRHDPGAMQASSLEKPVDPGFLALKSRAIVSARAWIPSANS